MAAPDLEKLENPDFIVEQEKAEEPERVAIQSPHDPASPLDDLTLDDITATPREKTNQLLLTLRYN